MNERDEYAEAVYADERADRAAALDEAGPEYPEFDQFDAWEEEQERRAEIILDQRRERRAG